MIRIQRGTEPAKLSATRVTELAKISQLGRAPTSKEITGYAIVGDELWRTQYRKCCYCEMIIKKKFHDVEHYRPKASADCGPGCQRQYGYWWLAWTWENLLFACPNCNRSEKNDRFPLAHGSCTLQDHQTPHGQEKPLLLNPADSINPIEHIAFVYEAGKGKGKTRHWRATPRNGSQLGLFSIDVFGLNTDELFELRDSYYEATIAHRIKKLRAALTSDIQSAIEEQFEEALHLLLASQPWVALCYDALRSAIPDAELSKALGRAWPTPNEIPLLPPKPASPRV